MEEHKSEKVSRRRFLDLFLGGSLTAFMVGIIYPIFRFLTPPEQEVAVVSSVLLGKVDDFAFNSGQIFRFGNKPGIIIRDRDGRFTAFFATCTHLDCIVQYEPDKEDILCACHNGRYDMNGMNISGPPPRPLTRLQVNTLPESGEVVVTLAKGTKA